MHGSQSTSNRDLDRLHRDIADLSDRLSELEDAPKTFIGKMKGIVPLVAITLSIVAATFTYWDRFVSKPRIAYRTALQELAHVEKDIQIALASFSTEGQMQLMSLTPKRQSLLAHIDDGFERFSQELSLNDLFLMINAYINLGEFAKASDYANIATSLSSKPIERANAQIAQARVHGAYWEQRDMEKARTLLHAAQDSALSSVSPFAGSVFLTALLDTFRLELSMNNCAASQDAVDKMVFQLKQYGSSDKNREFVYTSFQQAKDTSSLGCDIDLHVLKG